MADPLLPPAPALTEIVTALEVAYRRAISDPRPLSHEEAFALEVVHALAAKLPSLLPPAPPQP